MVRDVHPIRKRAMITVYFLAFSMIGILILMHRHDWRHYTDVVGRKVYAKGNCVIYVWADSLRVEAYSPEDNIKQIIHVSDNYWQQDDYLISNNGSLLVTCLKTNVFQNKYLPYLRYLPTDIQRRLLAVMPR
ncbi:MAG: hypothetical protein ACKKL5_03200 [Candidatus Komeilibacteria bacterium]